MYVCLSCIRVCVLKCFCRVCVSHFLDFGPSHLFYSTIFYSILFYSILFYSILFYSILFYSIPFYSILFYPFTLYSILFYPILSYPITFYSILSYPITFNSPRYLTADVGVKQLKVVATDRMQLMGECLTEFMSGYKYVTHTYSMI
jgi:hypothetical protein